MPTQIDNYPDHHPRCRVRTATLAGAACNCRDLRREPRLSEPSQERHWLEAIDHASNNPAIREELRAMVTRETTRAYDAGVADTERRLSLPAAGGPATITLHVHQHDLDQPCPPSCPHADTEHDAAQRPQPELTYDAMMGVELHERGALSWVLDDALADAVLAGTGWIRVRFRRLEDGDGVEPAHQLGDWTLDSPDPTTIAVYDQPRPVMTHTRNRLQAAVDHAIAAHTGPLAVTNDIVDAVVDVLNQPQEK